MEAFQGEEPLPHEDDDRLDRVLDEALAHLNRGEAVAVGDFVEAGDALFADVQRVIELAHEISVVRPLAWPTVAGYEILAELGRGAMGTVYLARQSTLGRRVALKILPVACMSSRRARRRFHAEASALARLRHPNVVPVHDVIDDGSVLAYSMEWIQGSTLGRVIQELQRVERPSLADVQHFLGSEAPPAAASLTELMCSIGLEVAHALADVHAARLLHRDVKPSNILLRRDGTPLLSDFGLVRDEQSTLHTETGQFLGTALYASPEQLRGDHDAVDERSDVYSLGVTLYQALSLELPYRSHSTSELQRRIEESGPVSLRSANPRIPPDLATVVGKALEARPERRYASAAELARDLERFLTGHPVLARPPSFAYRAALLARRNRLAATAAALVLTSLVLGVAMMSVGLMRARARAAESEGFSGAKRIQQLVEEATSLWPATPGNAALMQVWLDDVRAYLEEVPARRRVLEEMQRRNVSELERSGGAGPAPVTHTRGAQLARLEHQRGVCAARIAWSEGELAVLRARLESAPDEPGNVPRDIARHEAQLASNGEWLSALDAQIADFRVRTFATRKQQSYHDALEDFVTTLERVSEPDTGLVADVERRLAFALTVEERSRSGPGARELWDAALASVADREECPLYAGLELAPQLGLLPLGRDPSSGLWEFAHLQTGAPPERAPGGALEVREDTGLVFVLVPGGTFALGAQSADADAPGFDPQADANESPVSSVTLEGFFLSKYEMTQGQWLSIAGANPSLEHAGKVVDGRLHDLRHPVEQVTWAECDEVLRRLELVLPTEAQWEYAARAGTTTPWWTGATVESLAGAANVADRTAARKGWPYVEESLSDGFVSHAPVDAFRANAWGLHDVHGNVSEWCRNPFGEYGAGVADGDGMLSARGSRNRVYRGGSFFDPAAGARSARRYLNTPSTAQNVLGVRPARTLED